MGLGGLFGGGSETTTTTQERVIDLPAWYEDTLEQNVLNARDVAQQGFQGYEGDRFVPFSQDELSAFSQLRNFVDSGQTQQLLGQSQGLMDFAAQRAMQGPSLGDLQQYMSPYQQGVIDPVKLDAIRQFDKTRSMIGGNAVQAGAFGGERHGLLESEALKNLNENLSNIQARGDQSNYMQALQQYNLGTQAAGNMGSAIANLANVGQSLNIQGADALRGIGSMQRGLEQAGADFDFSEFMRETNQPYTDTQFLSNILAQVNPNIFPQTTTNTQTTDSGGGGLGSLIGAGIGLMAGPFGPAITGGLGSAAGALGASGLGSTLGMAGTGMQAGMGMGQALGVASDLQGAFGGSAFAMKEGGVVKGYKEGGKVQKYANGDLVEVNPDPTPVPNPFSALMQNIVSPVVSEVKDFGQFAGEIGRGMLPPETESFEVPEEAVEDAVPSQDVGSLAQAMMTGGSQGASAAEAMPEEEPVEETESITDFYEKLNKQRPRDNINMPLMMMGLAMMGSKGDLGQQLSAGGMAYLRAKELEKSQEAERTKNLLEMMDTQSQIKKREAEIAMMPMNAAEKAASIELKQAQAKKAREGKQINRNTLMADREDAIKEYNELASSLSGEDLPPKSKFVLDFLTGKGYTAEEIQKFAPDLATGQATSMELSGAGDPLGLR